MVEFEAKDLVNNIESFHLDYSSVICKNPMDSPAISFPSKKIVVFSSFVQI